MKNDFIPRRLGDLASFEENFLNKIAAHTTTLEISPDEVNSFRSIIEEHQTAFRSMNAKKTESNSAIEEHSLKRDKAVAELRRFAGRIKRSTKYTDAIGDDLGIIGTESLLLNSELKPALKLKVIGNEVVLRFQKNGTDGVRIYSKRNGETDFAFLALDTASPYTDNREKLDASKPESREYYAHFFDDDKETGIRSDIVKVIIP